MFFRIDILTIMLHTSFQDTNANHGREKGCSMTNWVNGLFLTCAFSQNELKVIKSGKYRAIVSFSDSQK